MSKKKKIKYLTLAGSLVMASGVGAQVYLCQQCPANTYSNGKQCIPCGYWETADSSSSSCKGLEFKINNTIQSFTDGGQEASGYLEPGIYFVYLRGGRGGSTYPKYYLGEGGGLGAELRYIFKVAERTPYTIASGEHGADLSDECSATGGGGGSWLKVGDTYYVAGGGGGQTAYPCSKRSSVGGWGGGVGGGGGGGDGDAAGRSGGASGHYKGGSGGSGNRAGGNGEGPSGGYGGAVDRTTCNYNDEVIKEHLYGGAGGYITKDASCAPDVTYSRDGFYFRKGQGGKASHKANITIKYFYKDDYDEDNDIETARFIIEGTNDIPSYEKLVYNFNNLSIDEEKEYGISYYLYQPSEKAVLLKLK